MTVKKYKAEKTIREFILNQSFVSLVVGPIGSGKSLGSVIRWLKLIHEQNPSDDGIRYTRTVVVRNTYAELKDTTVKTFIGWFGDALKFNWGNMTALYEHDGVHAEILFRSLDKPSDMSKLLSLEITYAYLNELRELPREALENVTSRLGRYPAVSSGTGATKPCAWADSNACDNEHWMYKKFLENRPDNHALFLQPPAILEDGTVNPEAENLDNLPYEYYRGFIKGKSQDWIDVMIRCKFIPLSTGKPVYPEYNDRIHCVDQSKIAPPSKIIPLICSADNGRWSAHLIGQMDALGRIVVFDEIISDDINLTEFGDIVANKMKLYYPDYSFETWIDPWAGNSRGQLTDATMFKVWNNAGLNCRTSHTGHPDTMVEAVKKKLGQIIAGQPALLISSKCVTLRKALNGSHQYKRVNVSGEQYGQKPGKSRFSHVANALEFLVDGTGASRELKASSKFKEAFEQGYTPKSNDWSVFQ